MQEMIFNENNFKHINIEEYKQINFTLNSKKIVSDMLKRLKNEGKILGKELEKFILGNPRQVFCMDLKSFINHLSITVLNFLLFCQPLKHLRKK